MLQARTEGPIVQITLADPDRHNALDKTALQQLVEVLEVTSDNADMRGLVLTGQGRSFCAGARLEDVEGSDWTENPLTEVCDRLERLSVPTICALNGGVYGGGVELALACDFRIGVTGMRMFAPPAELGIHYPWQGLVRCERLLGLQATRRIFLLAERFNADQLLDLGFLDRVVEGAALDAEVSDLCHRITALAPMAVNGMKQTLQDLGSPGFDADKVRDRIAACFASDDHAEALLARSQKRPPVFRGR